MSLTPEQRETLETRLTEAEDALHKLSIGGMASVYVDQNGERVEFNRASRANLRAYVMELKAALGQSMGVAGPMSFGILP
jgi:hypothetical protein